MGLILGIGSMFFIWLMGNKYKYAPMFGIGMQFLWFYYSVWVVKDYGLLVSVAGFLFINTRNQILWLREYKKNVELVKEDNTGKCTHCFYNEDDACHSPGTCYEGEYWKSVTVKRIVS